MSIAHQRVPVHVQHLGPRGSVLGGPERGSVEGGEALVRKHEEGVRTSPCGAHMTT